MIYQLFKRVSLASLSFMSLSAMYLLLTVNAHASDTGYTVSQTLSQVSIVTIKKQYVLEKAAITKLTGGINKAGQATINIPLKEIKTGIPIRDARLNAIFFESIKFPTVKITGNFNESLTSDKDVERKVITMNVELYGKTKPIQVDVIISKSNSNSKIMVSSVSPIIINANDFSIPASNLINLAKTVGGIPISSTVPVNFNVVFDKS